MYVFLPSLCYLKRADSLFCCILWNILAIFSGVIFMMTMMWRDGAASCIWYLQANTLAHKFNLCFGDIKLALFRVYCTSFYTAHLWCNYNKSIKRKLQVAYQDAIFLCLPRWTSVSKMFVTSTVPIFCALLRNYMYKFMCWLNVLNHSGTQNSVHSNV